jgi:hypothetical protein
MVRMGANSLSHATGAGQRKITHQTATMPTRSLHLTSSARPHLVCSSEKLWDQQHARAAPLFKLCEPHFRRGWVGLTFAQKLTSSTCNRNARQRNTTHLVHKSPRLHAQACNEHTTLQDAQRGSCLAVLHYSQHQLPRGSCTPCTSDPGQEPTDQAIRKPQSTRRAVQSRICDTSITHEARHRVSQTVDCEYST